VNLNECLKLHLVVDIHRLGGSSMRVPHKKYTWGERFEQMHGESYFGCVERTEPKGDWDEAKRYAFTLGTFNGRGIRRRVGVDRGDAEASGRSGATKRDARRTDYEGSGRRTASADGGQH